MPSASHSLHASVGRPSDVPGRSLMELAAYLGSDAPRGADGSTRLTGIALDSRAVRVGDLYAAIAGTTTHGARYAGDALAAGAVAAVTDPDGRDAVAAAGLPAYVVERPRDVLGAIASWIYGDPSTHLQMVGITGTNGKTTTSYLVEAGLRAAGLVTGLIGTIETRIDDVQVPSVHTTPEAPDLQAMLGVMRERGVAAVAMEVSSHALAMRRVDGTAYDVGVFTNLTPDHLDFHRDLQDYFAAKARLFTPELVGEGVINIDDAYGERLARDAAVPVVTVSPGGAEHAAWRVLDRHVAAGGSRFRLVGPDSVDVAASTALPGVFNIDNAALAIVALTRLGIDADVAATGVASLTAIPGRMQLVEAGQDFAALVDFAHSPDALHQLLVAARQLTSGRVIVVFGCGGDRDRDKRPVMGKIAAQEADVVVLTSDNPRSEDPTAIIAAILEGALRARGPAQVETVPDRRAAIERAVDLAGPSDLVVVAGKGHETGQEVAGVVSPFDDAEVLRQAATRAARRDQ